MAASGSSHSRGGNNRDVLNDERTTFLRKENADLKHRLVRLQGDYDEVLHEKNFYRVKVAELSEIIHAKGDDATKQLVTKSMQYVELSTELDLVKRDLHMAGATIEKIGSQREQNKTMLLELSQIVYLLKSVQVDHLPESEDSCQSSFTNIKAKVNAIMDDRRLLVGRCLDLEKANKDNDEKIVALEAQFHLLNSINIAKNDFETASQRPFPPSAAFSVTSHSSSRRPVVEIDIRSVKSLKYESMDEDYDTETSYSPILGYPAMSLSTSSKASPFTKKSAMELDADDMQHPFKRREDDLSCATELSTKPGSLSPMSLYHNLSSVSSEPEVQSLKEQLAESKHQHHEFKQVCQTAFSKMKTVEQDFAELQEECDEAKRKCESLKLHLRDVIDQYKTLNGEHEQTLEELENTKSQMQNLERDHEELTDAKRQLEDCAAEILEEDDIADDTEKLVKAYLITRSTIKTLQDKLFSAEREVEEAEKRRASGGRAYRGAVAKCRQQELEIKIMESRVAQTEEELEISKKENLKFKEEAKHTRRRLTAYMRGRGVPAQEDFSKRTNTRLLMPELQ